MKFYDFLKLSEEEQFNAVWSLGVLIDSFVRDNFLINLYGINDFYCEVYYDAKTNKTSIKR